MPWPEAPSLPPLLEGFHALHARRFSYADPEAPVELVALRLAATGLLPAVRARRAAGLGAARVPEAREVWLGGRARPLPVHQREQVTGPLRGPALIEEEYTTILLPEGWHCAPGAEGSLVARRAGEEA